VRRQMQERGEWGAIGDVCKKGKREQGIVSKLKEATRNVERESQKLRDASSAKAARGRMTS
jgi:hypothetical protein